MPNRQKAPQDVYLVARQGQGIHLESLERPTLSIWQSAVLAYASAKCGIKFTSIEHTDRWTLFRIWHWRIQEPQTAKCGIKFTSIEHTDRWLRTNPQNPQHLTVKAVFGLLLVEPPKKAGNPYLRRSREFTHPCFPKLTQAF